MAPSGSPSSPHPFMPVLNLCLEGLGNISEMRFMTASSDRAIIIIVSTTHVGKITEFPHNNTRGFPTHFLSPSRRNGSNYKRVKLQQNCEPFFSHDNCSVRVILRQTRCFLQGLSKSSVVRLLPQIKLQ